MGACGLGGGKHKVDDFYVQKFHVMSINITNHIYTVAVDAQSIIS